MNMQKVTSMLFVDYEQLDVRVTFQHLDISECIFCISLIFDAVLWFLPFFLQFWIPPMSPSSNLAEKVFDV